MGKIGLQHTIHICSKTCEILNKYYMLRLWKEATFMIPILENKRIYWYDNLKFFLMVLVVLGHGADYGTSQYASFRFAYLFVYIFHMPLFLFIKNMID